MDDHQLFRRGVFDFCIHPMFPNAEVLDFANGDEAFAYLSKGILEDDLPDLLITDVNHPGMRGDALVKSIRQAESDHCSLRPIPIIVLTFCDQVYAPLLKPGKNVDEYFCKSVTEEDLSAAIRRALGCL